MYDLPQPRQKMTYTTFAVIIIIIDIIIIVVVVVVVVVVNRLGTKTVYSNVNKSVDANGFLLFLSSL